MKHLFILLFTACTLLTYAQVPEGYPANYAKAPRFKALIYYTQHAEEAHVQFAEQQPLSSRSSITVTALFWILLPIFQNTHTRN